MNPLSRTWFHSPPLPLNRFSGQAPAVQGWQSTEPGRVAASPTGQHPGRVRLRNTKAQWSRFVATELPASTVLRIHAQSRGDFRITVEVATSAGPRTFVFISMGNRTFRLGSRYMVGMGRIFSPAQPGSTDVDLGAVARKLEPRVRVKAVTAMSVGAASSMFVEVADQQHTSDRAPLAPVPLPQGPVPEEAGPARTAQDSTPAPNGLDQQEQNERQGAADPPDRQIVQPPAINITADDAFRFLTQASFGATHQTLAELMQLNSYSDWMQKQLAMPPSLTEPYTVANSDGCDRATRHYVWWDNVIDGPDQLRQRLAFAWSQIFVVSDWDYPLKKNQYAMSNYYDMLATACTGNFRDLLEKVTLHPAMGVYLSMVRNQKADPARNIRPDENFAREVLQLFTIGLHQLSPDGQVIHQDGRPVPTYDQRTIEEFAKVFTGWNFADANHWIAGDVPTFDLRLPMAAWEQHHEPEAKELLGTTVAPGGTAAQDLAVALDTIFAHPNVGPFLARLLIQRLVTSNPTPAYVGRVAAVFANDGTGVRGNLHAVSQAILLDPEARGGHRSMPRSFGKLKEPIMRLTQLWRAFDAQPGPDAIHGYRPNARASNQIEHIVGQAPLRSDSVFNFFSPNHRLSPGSDMVAPELAILAETHTAATNNMLFEQIYSHHNRTTNRPDVTRINIEGQVSLASNPAELVSHLDTLLTGNTLSATFRQSLIAHLQSHPSDADGLLARTLDAIYAVVGSPTHLVQK